MRTFGRNQLLVLLLLGAFAWSGCESEKKSVAEESIAEETEGLFGIELEGVEGGFFDDESLLEGAVDIAAEEAEVVCVGEGREVRGIVLAPYARLAVKSSKSQWKFPDWLVGVAEASPLDGERPVAGALVRVYRVDARGVQVGEDFVSTRTSGGGRFCVRLPDGVQAGSTIVVEASAESEGKTHRLRRLLINAEDADLHLAPESFVQLLLENGVNLESAPLTSLMNLEVFAQTAVDLLNPIELSDEGGIEDGLELVKKTLLEDARFSAGLERLKKSSK